MALSKAAQAFISKKIKALIKEGKSPQQAMKLAFVAAKEAGFEIGKKKK